VSPRSCPPCPGGVRELSAPERRKLSPRGPALASIAGMMKRTDGRQVTLLGTLAAGALLVGCGGSSSSVSLDDAGIDGATGVTFGAPTGVASCGTIGAVCASATDCCVSACTGGVCGGPASVSPMGGAPAGAEEDGRGPLSVAFAGASVPLPAGEAATRREEFARLRTEEGKSVEEAAAAVEIKPRTAREYEAERLKAAGQHAEGGAP